MASSMSLLSGLSRICLRHTVARTPLRSVSTSGCLAQKQGQESQLITVDEKLIFTHKADQWHEVMRFKKHSVPGFTFIQTPASSCLI
ncbi:NADH dehydrogenase [ubiquinone] iron-sulfur protein 4, mitochondrial [Tachysurus ichikawai]